MRKLGEALGVDPMTLYRHVRDKNDVLDGAVDAVVGEIDPGAPGEGSGDWQSAMSNLAQAARRVMLRHPWVPGVIVERKSVGPATLGHIDRVLGILQAGGFSIEMAHHALHVLGSRMLGFTQDPFEDSTDPSAEPPPEDVVARTFAAFPNVARLAIAASHSGVLGGCDDDFEFNFSLKLILDGLERERTSSPADLMR